MICAICGQSTEELYELNGQADLCEACFHVAQDLTGDTHDTELCEIPGCPECRAIHLDLEADRKMDEMRDR